MSYQDIRDKLNKEGAYRGRKKLRYATWLEDEGDSVILTHWGTPILRFDEEGVEFLSEYNSVTTNQRRNWGLWELAKLPVYVGSQRGTRWVYFSYGNILHRERPIEGQMPLHLGLKVNWSGVPIRTNPEQLAWTWASRKYRKLRVYPWNRPMAYFSSLGKMRYTWRLV